MIMMADTSKRKKWLRQHEPSSSILFNITVVMLAIIIEHAKKKTLAKLRE
jgi:hypothetical protein